MSDAIVLLFLFGMFMSGLGRGTLRQLWSLAVLALSTFLSGNLYLAFIHLTGRFIQSEDGSKLASFVLVFMVISGILNGPFDFLVRHVTRREDDGTGFGDRMAAGVLGVIEAVGTVQVAAALLIAYPVLGWDNWVRASNVISTMISQALFMGPLLPFDLRVVLEGLALR
jgi:uncharacterized membrane protein required for colicin V production